MGINTLTINDIHSQQNFNKPKEKLRDHRHPFVDFSFGERFVEKMLRYYDLFLLKNHKKLYKTNQKHKEYFSPKESCAMIIRRNNFPFKRMKDCLLYTSEAAVRGSGGPNQHPLKRVGMRCG